MTVASEVNRSGPYTGNGVTTVFDYEFRILDETHIRVVREEAGIETTLTLGADYTVGGVGDDGGGSITVLVAPLSSQTITNLRNMPFTQETDLENQGPFFAQTIEDALDLGVMRDQQLDERLSRAVMVPLSDPTYDPDQFANDVRDVSRQREIAESAASALGNQVHQYDTRALAIAATIPLGVQAVKVTRWAAGYPLSVATYIPGTSAGPAAFQEAGCRRTIWGST